MIYFQDYFRYLTDKEKRTKINEIVAIEEGIAMASQVLITISKDEAERARLLSEYKYKLDAQSKLVHAERKGRQKGREEEREIIFKLLDQGLSAEEIKKRLI